MQPVLWLKTTCNIDQNVPEAAHLIIQKEEKKNVQQFYIASINFVHIAPCKSNKYIAILQIITNTLQFYEAD